MKLPTKITPDNLKHAIVSIKFSTNYPLEFLNARIYELLKSDLKYLPPAPVNIPSQNAQGLPELIQISTGVFVNEKIKLQINNSNLTFTNWDKYLGWDTYFGEIKSALTKLHDSGIISSYQSVGIRYVSEYINETLFDKIATDFRPKVAIDNTPVFKSTAFRSELTLGNKRIIINLADKLQRLNANLNTIEQFSLIDIDVISPTNVTVLNDLIGLINESHNTEKEIFFGLLKEEFINQLQPVY